MFDQSKAPLTKWFAAIYLVGTADYNATPAGRRRHQTVACYPELSAEAYKPITLEG